MPFIPSARQLIDQILGSGEVILASQIGAANGVAGLDANGDIVATPIHRVDTAAALAALTLKDGEFAVASDTNDILRGNGSTVGGILVQGGVRSYTVAPVSLTSTSAQANETVNVDLVPGVYRWWGVAGFSGDSDNQSNFAIGCGASVATADTSQSTQTGSAGGTFSWRLSKSTFFEAPTVMDWWPLSFASFATFTATPPTTNVAAGRCYFDFWLPIVTAHTRPFSIRLRQAKIGTPTIMGAYRLFVQRIS